MSIISLTNNQETQNLLKIFESLGDYGIWKMSIGEGKIWASEKAQQIYGLSGLKNGVIDLKSAVKAQSNEEINRIDKAFRDLIAGIVAFIELEYKIHVIKPNGQKETRYVCTKAKLIKNDASIPTEIVGTIQDITASKKTEREQRKNLEKIKEAHKLKSLYLENISHSIRTPMNAIIGFAELLNIGYLSENKQKEFANIIKNKGEVLLSLVDNVIEVSKYESGQLKIAKSAFNLNYLLKELATLYNQKRKIFQKDHLSIKFENENPNIPFAIYTDSGRLQQILDNLLNNALKYTEKGHIVFGYELVECNKLMFFVKDTGLGIQPEKQKIIFDRFRQTDDPIDHKQIATGLGLTIAKGIVELLGGKIWLESSSGNGSIFRFTIPYERPQPEKINNEDSTHEYANARRTRNWRDKIIVVAEDEEINFRFLEAVFEDTLAKVIRAENGAQVLELCKTLPKIDIILMDIKMPGINGYEATLEIKEKHPSIPIIAQTAYSMREDRDKCLQSGCDDYVSKPINITELLEKMNALI